MDPSSSNESLKEQPQAPQSSTEQPTTTTLTPSQIATSEQEDQAMQQKNTSKKKIEIIGSILGGFIILLFIISIAAKTQPKKQNLNTTPSTTPKKTTNQDLSVQINPIPQTIDKLLLYAKQTSDKTTNQKIAQTMTIYSYDLNTQQQTQLFTIKTSNNLQQNFYFIKDKNQILINLQYSLKIYDGKAGTLENIYNGNKETDFITGSAVSNDEQQIAFNVTNGMIASGEQKDNLYTANLNTKQTTLILSQDRSSPSGINAGWLSPYFWTPDNKAIIMNYIDNQNNILGMAEIAINGSNLHNLSGLIDTGQVSNDRNYYAYTQQADNPAPWACQDKGMTAIQLYNTQQDANTTIISDPISLFRIISWSPDNQQILYQQQKYQSGNGCSALFYDTQTYIYSLATQQTQQVSSPDDTMKAWNNFLSINTVTQQNQINLIVNGQIIDTVPIKDQLFSIGTIN